MLIKLIRKKSSYQKYSFSKVLSLDQSITSHQIHSQLKEYGFLLVKDSHINWKFSEEYFNLMEQYFENRAQQFELTGKLDDAFPELKYQVGLGNENIGKPNYDKDSIHKLIDKPIIIDRDPKWKYFWPFRYDGKYPIPRWSPKDFPQFEIIMNNWQQELLRTTEKVLELISLSFGENKYYFIDRMRQSSHLLSPIGCDLQKHQVDTRFSGYHYDLNFLTIHTKCRFPGLFVWLPNGTREQLKIPNQTVLLQPGKLFEYMTGGFYKAGYHEAVFTQEAKDISNKLKKRWRVTSTLFTMLDNDVILEPTKYFQDKIVNQPCKITVQEQFSKELEKLNYQ